jgi:hypothetical protein
MVKITIDSDLKKKLLYLTTPLELCDEDGQVLARLTPSTPWNDPENWIEIKPPTRGEETQPANANEPPLTTQELIERIKSRRNS